MSTMTTKGYHDQNERSEDQWEKYQNDDDHEIARCEHEKMIIVYHEWSARISEEENINKEPG